MILYLNSSIVTENFGHDIVVKKIDVAQELVLTGKIKKIYINHDLGQIFAEWVEGQASLGSIPRMKIVALFDPLNKIKDAIFAAESWWSHHETEEFCEYKRNQRKNNRTNRDAEVG